MPFRHWETLLHQRVSLISGIATKTPSVHQSFGMGSGRSFLIIDQLSATHCLPPVGGAVEMFSSLGNSKGVALSWSCGDL